LPHVTPDYHIRTFLGPGCAGNHHSVFINVKAEKSFDIVRWSTEHPATIACMFSYGKLSGGFRADFFCCGNNVQFCGSGLLAAAALVLGARDNAWVHTAVGRIELMRRRALYGFSCRPSAFLPLSRRGLWQNLMDQPVVHGVNVGGPRGYVILQLANASSVRNCQPDYRLMTALTGRALIVTARVAKAGYVMRYFAPQYGQQEDAATGSANALLVKYWFQQGLRGEMYGRQLSKQGAEFKGFTDDGTNVRLYGSIAILQTSSPC
jgi:Predicted epimerase, PhzC/PhzF homolog